MFKAVTPLEFKPGLGIENIQRGLGLGSEISTLPGQLALRREQTRAARQLLPFVTQAKEAKAQLDPEQQIAQTALLQAQAKKAKEEAKLGGVPISGETAERLVRAKLEQEGGDPAIIQDLKNRWDARTALLNQMSRTYGLPQVGKYDAYEDTILGQKQPIRTDTENSPTGATGLIGDTNPQQLSPMQRERLQRLKAAEQKLTSDPDTRKQVLGLNEIISQYDSVPFDRIKKYAGLVGIGKRALNDFASIFGAESPDFDAYKVFHKQTLGMTDQLRKALGTSIRNEYVKTMLLPMVDTISKTWSNNPKIAEQQWKWFGNWMKEFRNTYTQAVANGIPTSQLKNMDIIDLNPHLKENIPGRPPIVQSQAPVMPKEQWMAAARRVNPNKSDAELGSFYDSHYGSQQTASRVKPQPTVPSKLDVLGQRMQLLEKEVGQTGKLIPRGQ